MDDSGRLLQYDEAICEKPTDEQLPGGRSAAGSKCCSTSGGAGRSSPCSPAPGKFADVSSYSVEDAETALDTIIFDPSGAVAERETLCGDEDDAEYLVERVSVSSTKREQSCLRGSCVLLVYIMVWLAGALAIPAGLLCLAFHYWTCGGVLLGLSLLGWLVPLSPNARLRRFCLSNFVRYFAECSLSFEHVPDPEVDRPTVLAVTPHGVFSFAWALCFLSDELAGFWFCFSNLLRLNPWLRVLTESLGHPSAVSRKAVLGHMRGRRNIALIPGAWHEATIHNTKADRAWIMNRRGFIKYALQNGYSVTPCYCFGEKETYWNFSGCYRFRLWLNDHRIMAILPWGRCWCPLLPRPCRLHVVVGAPLQLPWLAEPTAAEVAFWHAAYVRAVEGLFNRHKVRCYGPGAESLSLEVW